MTAKHTAGPWIVDHTNEADKGHVLISTASGNKETHIGLAQVVWVMDDDAAEGNNTPKCEANAHLIAAAPELLAALISAKWMLERDFIDDQKYEVIEKCEAAIAKAKGEQK